MKGFILILLAFSINLVGCSSEPTKPILEERAGYNVKGPPLSSVGGSGGISYIPTRVPEKVIVGWLFPHDMPSKVYFWGSWLSIVVEDESWAMVKVEAPKNDKMKRTGDKPKKSPPKNTGVQVRPTT